MRHTTYLIALALALAGCKDNASTTADGSAAASAPPAVAPAAPAAAARPAIMFDGEDYQGEITRYEIVGNQVIEAIDRGATAEEIEYPLTELTGIFDVLVPRFVEVHPHCADYLKAATELRFTWREMTPADVEAGYHNDKLLPPTENAQACTIIKNLLVRPMTALVMVNTGASERENAKRELTDVLSQIPTVRQLPR